MIGSNYLPWRQGIYFLRLLILDPFSSSFDTGSCWRHWLSSRLSSNKWVSSDKIFDTKYIRKNVNAVIIIIDQNSTKFIALKKLINYFWFKYSIFFFWDLSPTGSCIYLYHEDTISLSIMRIPSLQGFRLNLFIFGWLYETKPVVVKRYLSLW